MLIHVDLLLGFIKSRQAVLEELVLNFVVFFNSLRDFLGRLVVSKLAGLSQHNDVRWRVDLLKGHFQLIEQPQSVATFSLHDLVTGH